MMGCVGAGGRELSCSRCLCSSGKEEKDKLLELPSLAPTVLRQLQEQSLRVGWRNMYG